jgi:hypothetical protein
MHIADDHPHWGVAKQPKLAVCSLKEEKVSYRLYAGVLLRQTALHFSPALYVDSLTSDLTDDYFDEERFS